VGVLRIFIVQEVLMRRAERYGKYNCPLIERKKSRVYSLRVQPKPRQGEGIRAAVNESKRGKRGDKRSYFPSHPRLEKVEGDQGRDAGEGGGGKMGGDSHPEGGGGGISKDQERLDERTRKEGIGKKVLGAELVRFGKKKKTWEPNSAWNLK